MAAGKRITIIGCGPGAADYLSPAAFKAAADAECLVAAKKLLALFPENGQERIAVGADVSKALDAIAARVASRRIAVLVSGDPGLCSLARPVLRRFGRDACAVIPGISSVQYAFAKAGLDWWDAKILTAHGETPDVDEEALRREDKIAILAGTDAAIRWIGTLAEKLGGGRRILVCENLSLDGERVAELTPEVFYTYQAPPMTVVLLVKGECLT